MCDLKESSYRHFHAHGICLRLDLTVPVPAEKGEAFSQSEDHSEASVATASHTGFPKCFEKEYVKMCVCAHRLAKTSKARFSRNSEVYNMGEVALDDKVTFL